ncbi:MAG: AAA family ATPase [Lachnospiraceae bacterium]|nr:AAA family ATPase [Lachnospiraceae bacterium]
MRDDIDDSLSGILGKRSNYTLDEIKEAQKRRKKEGGNLIDNLRKVTGRSLPNASYSQSLDIGKMCEDRGIDLDKRPPFEPVPVNSDSSAAYYEQPSYSSINEAMADARKLESEIDSFTKDIDHDYNDAPATPPGPEKFSGLADELMTTVLGQQAFLKKLTIAFKRPFVLSRPGKLPANTIYITGPAYTGRHFALSTAVKLMASRGILRNPEVTVIDLSLYPSAGEEKLFLQDLYCALSSENEVILFENFENCHISFLNNLCDLVMKGQCQLSSRYVLQNGQLINVANSLAHDAVGTFDVQGKFLVFISTGSIEKLADCFGAPFVNSISDICETDRLSRETIAQIAQIEMNKLKELASTHLHFNLQVADEVVDHSVAQSDKNAGLRAVLKFYEDFLDALVQIRLETDLPEGADIHLYMSEDGRVTAESGGEATDLFACLPATYTTGLEAVREELNKIVGLASIKEYILGLEEYYRIKKRRSEEGLKSSDVSKHMIFTGNPGTGKTTIARIISRYLKAIGVLTGGQLVEVSRADLVGRYVGHTAPLTNQVIKSAIGGVLFIDEAYSLYRGTEDSFGLEAIDTLVKGIEDNRDNLVVILAGYSNEMEEFLSSNSGLKSRFPNLINFPDYTGEELVAIAHSIAAGKGYSIDEGADTSLLSYFNAVQALRPSDAGNGRLARNKVEEAILNQSRRLVAEPDGDLSLLLSQDFDLSDIAGDKI